LKKIIGPLIFVLVALAVGWWHLTNSENTGKKSQLLRKITVNLLVGGEKMNFIKNPQVKEILLNRYGITLNAGKAGSIEMVTSLSITGKDALWPSNQIAVELFRDRGGTPLASENIFNSPIVLYTYDIVAEALIKQKLLKTRDQSLYLVDFPLLLNWIQAGKQWKEIGLSQLYGKIAIWSTDPTRSNSGNMLAALLANMFNGGAVVNMQSIDQVMPRLKNYFSRQGYMASSSSDIFKTFITTGVGSKPIIAGYESQLVEFAIENSDAIDYLRQKIRTLYPEPTVWSSHPVIALTAKGKRLIEALKDKELQEIAWEKHGFRSGLMGVQNDPSLLSVTGIPETITAVLPMPDADIMEKIIASLQSN